MTFILKIVFIGESGSGKSWLVGSYYGCDLSKITGTIGIHFNAQSFNIDGKEVRAQLWDTNGQEKFSSLAPMYYRGANAIIMIYDVTNYSSFMRIKEYWMEQVRKYAGDEYIVMLVGTKIDLEKQRRVTTVEAMELAMEHKWFFAETSALNNVNVESTFKKIVEEAYRKKLDMDHRKVRDTIDAIRLHEALSADEPKESPKCCNF